jgi:uncharacterized protein (DUF1684 family)
MSEAEGDGYRLQIEKWRKEREASLRAPDGWLSLVGLFMLTDDEYSVGSGNGNDIVLPPSAPQVLGSLSFQQGKTALALTRDVPGGVAVLVNGEPLDAPANSGGHLVELHDNSNGRPTIVKAGSVSFNVHKFGEDFALRVRDSASPAIQEFSGCSWYEIQPDHRLQGHLIRQRAPTPIAVPTSVKTVAEYQKIGAVEFELQGRPLQLLAAATSKPNEIFIILRDATAGRETYGAGRYLYAEVDEAGNVDLDFNKAYNPPCAFTPYATCSLPPAQNILPVAIEAGERI